MDGVKKHPAFSSEAPKDVLIPYKAGHRSNCWQARNEYVVTCLNPL